MYLFLFLIFLLGMIDSTELVLESVTETQLKLKILHSCKTIYLKDSECLSNIKENIIKIFLKIIYSVNLKKVLSSKVTNRIILKYFKSFIYSSSFDSISNKNQGADKVLLDKPYLSTVAINSLYEFYAKKVS